MPQIELAPEILDDFDRFFDHPAIDMVFLLAIRSQLESGYKRPR